jgi:putative DNA primase/helicase
MGEIRRGRKEDYITQSSGIPFVQDAKAPRWELFLKEIFNGDERLISFIKRAAGYSLTGLTVEEIILICWGNGRNGKTVLLNTLRKILGDYADNTPFSTFEIDPKGKSQNTNDLAKLVGKRLVTSSETSGSVRLNEERVKALTGRDPITCRFLFQEFFTYTPAYKIWLAVNHKPVIIGVDEGIWTRVRLIPFAVSFRGREDKYLEETLEKELPGILQWAISGCLEWQEKGLPQPGLVQKATDEYRSESDIVGKFLKEKTEEKKGSKIQATVLYEAFKAWVEENGEALISSNAFGRRVTDQGVRREEGRCNYYVDIAIL